MPAMTYNLEIWLIPPKKYTFKFISILFKLIFYNYSKKYVVYGYNCRFNQSAQHNLKVYQVT